MFLVVEVGDPDAGAKGQCAVRSGEAVGFKQFSAGGSFAMQVLCIVGNSAFCNEERGGFRIGGCGVGC